MLIIRKVTQTAPSRLPDYPITPLMYHYSGGRLFGLSGDFPVQMKVLLSPDKRDAFRSMELRFTGPIMAWSAPFGAA
jgi:hypothetical protein